MSTDLTLTELIDEAVKMGGPWRRATNIASSEEEHVVYLTNDVNDSVIVNADGVALLFNAAIASGEGRVVPLGDFSTPPLPRPCSHCTSPHHIQEFAVQQLAALGVEGF